MVTKELQELIKDRVKRTGKISSQKTWKQELKEKAQKDKKLRGQQTLTSAVSTSRRLSEFGYDPKTKSKDIYEEFLLEYMTPEELRKIENRIKSKRIKAEKTKRYDPIKLVSGIPSRWFNAMVAGIKNRSDVKNPYAVVKNIWERLSAKTKASIQARAAKGEVFKYNLPLPDDRSTKGTGTLRMVKPFKLAEAQVNVSKKDMQAVKKSGIFRPMKRNDGSICQVARCKGAHSVNIFVDEV